MNDIVQAFGAVLQRLRVERNLSQEELAHRADVDRTFVSRLERGVRQPTITTLMGLGQALGVSAAELVRDAEREWRHRKD
jgi:transcriptional regulator with XRE-family HTH domain